MAFFNANHANRCPGATTASKELWGAAKRFWHGVNSSGANLDCLYYSVARVLSGDDDLSDTVDLLKERVTAALTEIAASDNHAAAFNATGVNIEAAAENVLRALAEMEGVPTMKGRSHIYALANCVFNGKLRIETWSYGRDGTRDTEDEPVRISEAGAPADTPGVLTIILFLHKYHYGVLVPSVAKKSLKYTPPNRVNAILTGIPSGEAVQTFTRELITGSRRPEEATATPARATSTAATAAPAAVRATSTAATAAPASVTSATATAAAAPVTSAAGESPSLTARLTRSAAAAASTAAAAAKAAAATAASTTADTASSAGAAAASLLGLAPAKTK